MKRTGIPVAGLILSLAFTCGAENLVWQPNYATALKSIAESDKLIMVIFSSEDCPYCTRFKEETLKNPAVIAALSGFLSVELTAMTAEGRALGARFGINTTPTVFFLDREEGVVGQIPGFVEAAAFIEETKKARGKTDEFRKLLAAHGKNPDAANSVALVEAYLERQQSSRIGDLMTTARSMLANDTKLTFNQKKGLSGRLYIVEAFLALNAGKSPAAGMELLTLAQQETDKSDIEVAARACFLKGMLSLETQSARSGIAFLEETVRKYPSSQWAELAGRYLALIRAQLQQQQQTLLQQPGPRPRDDVPARPLR
ncbi:MAG: thioredoxin family protein [Planctomycetes bacterium]|nr:thioredoxin family protein [Planctomycetota bacterium]